MPMREFLSGVLMLTILLGGTFLATSCGDSSSGTSGSDGGSTAKAQAPSPSSGARNDGQVTRPSTAGTKIPQAPGAGPAPIMVQPPVVRFGVVDPGSTLTTVVTLANGSDRPLRILKAQPSCTCTTLDLDNTIIPARSSIEVPIDMETNRAVGLKKAIVQLAIEGYQQFTTIELQAETAWGVRTTPLYLGVRERANQPERRLGTINLESLDQQPFQVLSTNGMPPEFIGFDPAKDAPRARYTIRYDLSMYGCDDLPPFYIIRTDHPKAQLFDMRVRHDPCTRILPRINMEDFRSSLGIVSPGAQITVPLVFKKPKADIISATSMNPMLQTTIVERIRDGQNMKVRVLTTVAPDAPEGLFLVPIQFTDGTRTVEHTFYGWVER